MTNYSVLKEQVLGFLRNAFADLEIQLTEVEYCGPISAVFVKAPSQQRLEEIWNDFSNAIAIYYQTKLETEFERWNLYLFYVLEEETARGLKYKIENDPISSRKIVIDRFTGNLDQAALEAVIAQHITNTNLNINKQQPAPLAFIKNVVFGSDIETVADLAAKTKSKSSVGITDLLTQIENRLQK